ncbi:Maleylacetoacetate isomerase, putative [Talaromyces stipitatus ATCC 10500]|uniref:Maleylacetoacetate isomerase, putative n=1 Tax=Talaromyces stipitatus (strain ATCC 10500 / CBS 375.48 / QM 6759 / NRRL 1006) TaxID=441959 RepID=B8MAD4_TALSN|nr:Maleylacetoacetate isomerase, putative [Talaromyces stipitatus ATCC 10500]EED18636.1 Maleylacetoacetate isomerase, putative [Talaromyces stipitatus ATCC 10500]
MAATADFTQNDTEAAFHFYSYYRSSCCQRIIIAAHLKGIDLEYSYLNFSVKEHRTDGYKNDLNPSTSVPTLVITPRNGGEKTIIRQSMATLDAMSDRVYVRDLTNIITIDTQLPTNFRIVQRVRALRESLDDQVALAHPSFIDGFEAFEDLLVKQGSERESYSFGNSISMADVVLVPTVDQLVVYRLDLDFVPNVKRVCLALKELDAFKAAHWRNQGDTPERFRANDCTSYMTSKLRSQSANLHE